MRATRFCLSVVGRGRTAGSSQLADDVDEVSDFLVSHVANLLEGATAGTSPVTSFRDAIQQSRFEQMRAGSDAEFLAAADSLTLDLIAEMGHVNSKEGVLVCASFQDDDGVTLSAALKLQVVSDHGAVLEKLASGATVLSAVERVLDRPGELQKGLVFADPRAESDAVVGDKANRSEARYFLIAMGVEAEEHSKKALGVVASAVIDSAPSASRDAIIRNLGSATSSRVEDVVAAAIGGVEMERPVEEVLRALDERERPVRAVDTKTLLKSTIRADSIKIDLPAADLQHVDIARSVEGGWEITIRVESEPIVNIHS